MIFKVFPWYIPSKIDSNNILMNVTVLMDLDQRTVVLYASNYLFKVIDSNYLNMSSTLI